MNSMSKRISRRQAGAAIAAMSIAWQGSWQEVSANQAGQGRKGSPM